MDEKQRWELVQAKLEEKVGPILKIISYMEYQTDLMAQVIKDLSAAVDTTALPADAQGRLAILDQFLSVSSVDFANLESPYEAFKIPSGLSIKHGVRSVRKPFLDAVLKEEGLI